MQKRSSLLWLFDLDNTLHNASHAIFPVISKNMNAFLARVLGEADQPADAERVNAIRQQYYARYGVTMLGMVRHHGVKADEFLQEVHHFDDLASMIRYERGLKKLLRRLPGQKILLTNAPRIYSGRVLRHIGLHRHFDAHIPVEAMRVHGQLQPKPSRPYLRKLLATYGKRASDCILVEDSVENLLAAKQEGLRTVWVTGYTPVHQRKRAAACADIKVKSVIQLARQLRRLRT